MHTFHRARVAPRVVHGGPYWWMWGTPRAQTWLRQFAESDWTASDLVEVGTPLLHSLRLRSSRHRRRNRTGWSIGAIQRCCLRWSDGTARAGPRTSVSSITVRGLGAPPVCGGRLRPEPLRVCPRRNVGDLWAAVVPPSTSTAAAHGGW